MSSHVQLRYYMVRAHDSNAVNAGCDHCRIEEHLTPDPGQRRAAIVQQPLSGPSDGIDFVLTLGGDGLLMHSGSVHTATPLRREVLHVVTQVLALLVSCLTIKHSTLFKEAVPPHLCFNLGSMGFLTPFELTQLKQEASHCSIACHGTFR